MSAHPLDRPVHAALTGRQAHLAQGDGRALRLDPEYGPFGAAIDAGAAAQAALAALVPDAGALWLLEPTPVAAPPGTRIVRQVPCDQMVAERIAPADRAIDFAVLGEADAAEMRALAALTQPGPFHARTHRLGRFIGLRDPAGRLVAMAGERMQAGGFTEVSGVCTHPDHRGRGHAAKLIRAVAAAILARGAQPFLHVYPDNAGAIALYQSLGFAFRAQLVLTLLARA